MAILLKVEWVDRADNSATTRQNFKHIGGSSGEFQWKHSTEQAIKAIERNEFAYYIKENAGTLKLEIGMTPDGQKFLKTQADSNVSTHLLNLPSRPQPARVAKYR